MSELSWKAGRLNLNLSFNEFLNRNCELNQHKFKEIPFGIAHKQLTLSIHLWRHEVSKHPNIDGNSASERRFPVSCLYHQLVMLSQRLYMRAVHNISRTAVAPRLPHPVCCSVLCGGSYPSSWGSQPGAPPSRTSTRTWTDSWKTSDSSRSTTSAFWTSVPATRTLQTSKVRFEM